MVDIEIEIKVKVERTQGLIKYLKTHGKFVGQEHQVDTYYSPKHENYLRNKPVKKWLRLRNSTGKFSINYKYWHYRNGKSYYADEFESVVDSLGQMEKIFKALEVKPLVTVDKKRQVWIFQDYEIAIDRVKGLGEFIEIEYKGKLAKKSPKLVTQEMIDFLKKHGCGKIVRNYVGYPFLLLFPNDGISEVF